MFFTLTLMGLLLVTTIAPAKGCEQMVEMLNLGETGDMISPNFPSNYTPSMCCEYHYEAPQGYRVRIHFKSFALEHANNDMCGLDQHGDSLRIFDGIDDSATRSWSFCGTVTPPDIVSSGSNVYAIFQPDFARQARGFSAQITAVADNFREPLPSLAPGYCNAMLSHAGGAFYSPGFPNPYMVNEECIYIVSIPDPKQHILLRFLSFELEPSYTCAWDYIEVRNGLSSTSHLIGRYCGGADWLAGKQPPEIIATTGPDMYVEFYSDSVRTYRGFYVEYTSSHIGFPQISENWEEEFNDQISVCDYSHAPMFKRGGVIVSHHSYPKGSYGQGLNCSLLIVAQQSVQKIYIAVLEMDITNSRSCNGGDSVIIIDGNLTHQTSAVCGVTIKQYSSSSYYTIVSFITDMFPNEEFKGFKLIYSAYYEIDKDSPDLTDCQEGDFLCDNNRCINKSLVCDGYDHCGDETDENPVDCDPINNLIPGLITLGIAACSAIAIIAVTCIWNKKIEKMEKIHPIQRREAGNMIDDDSPSTCIEEDLDVLERNASTANLPRGDPVNAVSGTLTTSVAYLDLELRQAKYIAHSPDCNTAEKGKQDLYPKQEYTTFLASGLDVRGPRQLATPSQHDSKSNMNDIGTDSGIPAEPKKRSKHKKSKKRHKKSKNHRQSMKMTEIRK
ncbi:neuropilin-1-like [Amphiura filiformis]|uniref:neuropilin-1-like n=1 Tax=Amphiura filiformis TaxID=82378 RepID=UPI003B21890D